MNSKKCPTLIIFAGANGCGKTTLAKKFLPEKNILEFVNADEIAMGLSPLNPESQKITAGKLVLKRITALIKEQKDFAIETTFSGHNHIHLIKMAKKADYHIRVFYIYTNNIAINIGRIKSRVKEGGHNVPSKDVRRRYQRSIHNLFHHYEPLCDIVSIYDNSSGTMNHIAIKTQKTAGFIYYKSLEDEWKTLLKKAGVTDE